MARRQPFGTASGRAVERITLTNGTMAVELITLGAAVRAICLPDRSGVIRDVCLGYDTAEEYAAEDGCLGATLGRCANRIGGARFTLNGVEYRLTANEGPNTLHGGAGFHKRIWNCVLEEDSAVFSLDSPGGEDGFPGNLHVEVTYTLREHTLAIDYRAAADADTVVNLTNHTYFNLAGHDSGRVDRQTLTVRADRYTPAGPGNIPTGEIAPVDGTALDLRQGVVLGEGMYLPALAESRGYDSNLVLTGGAAPAAELYSPDSGIAMELFTDTPGVQLYSSGFLTPRRGKEGAEYGPYHAVCLETQYFPDAVNHPNFLSPVLRAGEEYRQTTRFRFLLRD